MTQSSATLQQVSLSSSLTSSPYAPSHLDHTLLNSNPTGGLPALEPSIYSLTSDLPSLSGGNNSSDIDSGAQKITLLTRSHTNTGPSQTPLSSSPLGSRLDDSVLSRLSSSVHSASLLNPADTSPLSRPREYYYDTEDPSVNLHDFIINSLQAPKNRVILLQLEEEFLKYVSDPKRTEPLKLPSWDSYHRMLAHRVAAYFGLEHNVDPQDKTRVVVMKGPGTRIPQQRFTDHIPPVYEESEISEPKSILKRIRGSSGSEKFEGLSAGHAAEIKTFEEREEEYEKARARIFSSTTQLHETDTTDIPFDLFSSSPFARSGLRTPLHHRRTFSDTAFINKLFSQKEAKPGPSSSGNSPSNTPAFFPPSPPNLSASSSSAAVGGVISQLPSTPQEEVSLSQHVSRQQHPKRVVARPPPPSYMPLYTMQGAPPPTAIPVMYHPQAVIDPNWYYNHMVLYPLSPQSAFPPYSPLVQSPVIPHYAIPQHGVIQTTPRVGVRMPSATMVTDHVNSSTHSGGLIYRPLHQQPPGAQMKSEDYSGVPTNPIWSSQPVAMPTAVLPGQSGTTSQFIHPSNMMGGITGQLAEQMEKSLTLSESGIDSSHSQHNDVDKMGVLPIGQRQGMYFHGGRVVGRGQTGLYGYPPNMMPDQMVVSPTALVPPSQFIHGQLPPDLQGGQPPMPPNNHPYPSNLPLHGGDTPQPPTPTLPPVPAGILQSGPGMQSPVQILGHTLSTSIFSPPPSAGPPGLFMNPSNSSKLGVTPSSPGHAAVGSGVRFQHYDSPKQTRNEMPIQTQVNMGGGPPHDGGNGQQYTNGPMMGENSGLSQPLPPRLAHRGSGGTRYQNQRHPSNRSTVKSDQGQQQYGGGPVNISQSHHYTPPSRKEPLLPTPSEMIKLDTGITAGVPVHIMEVLHPPSEDSPDNQQLMSRLNEHGALEFKRGWMNRNTEIMVAIFDSSDTALQALKQCVLPTPAKLSIPLPTHAKHILQIL